MRLRLNQAKYGAGTSRTKKGDIEVVREVSKPRVRNFNELEIFVGDPTDEQQAQYPAVIMTVLTTGRVAVRSLGDTLRMTRWFTLLIYPRPD